MKKESSTDIGTLFVFSLVFGLIFLLIHYGVNKFGLDKSGIEFLIDAFISAWAWLYWPRGEK